MSEVQKLARLVRFIILCKLAAFSVVILLVVLVTLGGH